MVSRRELARLLKGCCLVVEEKKSNTFLTRREWGERGFFFPFSSTRTRLAAKQGGYRKRKTHGLSDKRDCWSKKDEEAKRDEDGAKKKIERGRETRCEGRREERERKKSKAEKKASFCILPKSDFFFGFFGVVFFFPPKRKVTCQAEAVWPFSPSPFSIQTQTHIQPLLFLLSTSHFFSSLLLSYFFFAFWQKLGMPVRALDAYPCTGIS